MFYNNLTRNPQKEKWRLEERFKSPFQNWVFEKDVESKYSLRLSQLEYTRFPRAANEPPRATLCGVSSRPSLPLESRVFQLLGWFFILNGLLYYFNSSNHNIYHSLIRSATSLIGTEGGDSCGNSKRSSVGRTIVQSHEP